MTQKRIFKITGARCTEDANYCESLGELFEKLEDGEIEAECDLSDELLDKIHKTLTFLSTMHDNGTAGAYCLSGAYGGYKLEQYAKGGGIRSITSGYVPKRELYALMQAYLAGMADEIERQEEDLV